MTEKSKQLYKVKAKIQRIGTKEFWMQVGTANALSDGRIIMTLDALPLHSDGVLMLYPSEPIGGPKDLIPKDTE